MLFVEVWIALYFYTCVLSDVKRISIAKNKNTEITTLRLGSRLWWQRTPDSTAQ